MPSAPTRLLLAALALAAVWPARAESVRMLVQNSPLAGFQYHAGTELWQQIRVGDALDLVREPDNPHDRNAVRVEWRGRKLGYLPRAENRAVSAELDLGTRLAARVSHLREERNPWRRIGIDIYAIWSANE
ncbi:MAG TPA: HIRAN domain-containing protein [Rhodocyclaceae bacterium]|nr:HIRAN domain-containing protein [Rhodocyclaceae bacterium]